MQTISYKKKHEQNLVRNNLLTWPYKCMQYAVNHTNIKHSYRNWTDKFTNYTTPTHLFKKILCKYSLKKTYLMKCMTYYVHYASGLRSVMSKHLCKCAQQTAILDLQWTCGYML